ncbi:MAG: hypothetical protein QQN46_01640 [Nitrosopumilus sp.]
MLTFLHKVLYIPNPKIIVPKAISGIKMKMLAFLPMIIIRIMTIKLSQF